MKAVLPMIAGAILALAAPSCTTVTMDSEATFKGEPGVPGGELIRTSSLQGTVTAIDTARREVSVVTRHHEKFDLKAGPEVVNFERIRIGDQLKVSVREQILVRMAKPGEKLDEKAYVTANLAKVGAKPSAKVTDTQQFVATITAIDVKKRKATLRFSDGSSGKFDVRPDVDITREVVGEKVLIRTTESIAIAMTKP